MEKVTPLDLERAQIPRALRGYAPEAVDRMLAAASQQLESQLLEIRRLNAALKQSDAELERFRGQESTLNSALVIAQRASDETRALAHKEAALIVEAAKAEAAQLLAQSQAAIASLHREIEALERDRALFHDRFRALLREHLDRLERDAPSHAVLVVQSPETEAATG